ncbi:hypothetical protein SUDANB121_05812 [Nocardiopsis dassonvillei]|uniref:hypothetical protein n=1 Tax=Nocardiopsis dassonvillei TaxID=2014 RepID=UPI003F5767B5
MLRRLRFLARIEGAYVVLIPVSVVWILEMPPTVANLAALALVTCLVLQGSVYWKLKYDALRSGGGVPRGLPVFRVLRVLDVILLGVSAVLLVIAAFRGEAVGRLWPGVALWCFALIEYVNYFHLQLSVVDTRNDRERLKRGKAFHRSHLARDLERGGSAELWAVRSRGKAARGRNS